jgi:hypothetical protein
MTEEEKCDTCGAAHMCMVCGVPVHGDEGATCEEHYAMGQDGYRFIVDIELPEGAERRGDDEDGCHVRRSDVKRTGLVLTVIPEMVGEMMKEECMPPDMCDEMPILFVEGRSSIVMLGGILAGMYERDGYITEAKNVVTSLFDEEEVLLMDGIMDKIQSQFNDIMPTKSDVIH